ncbi:shisa family member 2a [Hoplias malabaricus]|uniref:shisa family member 2a n=1 Tax=Hoplias malabaricus TaxID=27720 RepID=UPI003461896B
MTLSPSLCALLWLLCALPMPAPAARAPPAVGQYCHMPEGRGFRCDVHARYCCGTCAERFCCASPAARLDQSTCEDEEPEQARRSVHGGDDAARSLQHPVPTYLPFVIVVGAFLSFVLLGALVSMCCCYCVKPPSGLLEPGVSSSPARSSTSGSGFTPPQAPPLCSAPGPTLHQATPHFYQPFLNFPLPPEHALLMTPAFLDTRAAFGQSFPQAPMHTEPLYPTVTV